MKIRTATIILGLAAASFSQSCNNDGSSTSSTITDSATIQVSEDENKESTFSGNQYANDSTVTRSRTDTSSGNASSTYSTNQYSSDSNVIKK